MKKIILFLFLSNLIYKAECQNTDIEFSELNSLTDKINLLQEQTYQHTGLSSACYFFEINMEDSILIFRRPIESLVGNRYDESRIQITVLPIKNLHPKSATVDIEKDECFLSIISRRNEDGFLDFISDDQKIRLLRKDIHYNANRIGISSDDCSLLNEISNLLNQLISRTNADITKDEEPPDPNDYSPTESSLRSRVLDMSSELEKTELVLPLSTLDKPPLYGENENFIKSIEIFEQLIINEAQENNIKLEKDILGYLIIDDEGIIVEVLMGDTDVFTPNNLVKELILKSSNWMPAIFNNKNVISKVKFFISMKKVNGL